jgi:hypothetical protein
LLVEKKTTGDYKGDYNIYYSIDDIERSKTITSVYE